MNWGPKTTTITHASHVPCWQQSPFHADVLICHFQSSCVSTSKLGGGPEGPAAEGIWWANSCFGYYSWEHGRGAFSPPNSACDHHCLGSHTVPAPAHLHDVIRSTRVLSQHSKEATHKGSAWRHENYVHYILYKKINNPLLKFWFLSTLTLM